MTLRAQSAFDTLRHDGAVADAEGTAFFDPALGHGLRAWRAALEIVRAVAAALDHGRPDRLAALSDEVE